MRKLLAALAFALWATAAPAQVITPAQMRDSNLTLSNVQNLVTTLNTFTAQRTLTLPGAGVMNSYYLQFIDTANAINGVNTLRIVSADGTLVNGLSALTVSAAGVYLFILPSPSGYSVSAIYPLGASTPAGGTNGQIQYNNAGFLGGFTMSGDATLATSTGVLTLATVNTNTGTWGSATQCAAFTTNGKGLITAAAQSACTPALANITGMGTGVAAALAIAVGSAGSPVVNGGALGTPSSGTLTNTTGFPVANLSGAGAGCLTWFATPSSANLRGCLTDETGTGLAYFQGGDIGTPSAGVGTNLTALNASNLASGTVAAARGGAGTVNGVLAGNGSGAVSQGTCAGLSGVAASCATDATNATNITSGTLASARYLGAWASFTPTLSCGSGTLTSASATGNYIQFNKTIHLRIVITITTNGTCAGTVKATLPVNLNGDAVGAGFDSVSGKTLQIVGVTGAPTLISVSNYDGTYPGANADTIRISLTYESI